MDGVLLHSAHVFLVMIMSIIGIVIGNKFYSSVKNEDRQEKGKIIQTLLKRHVVVQCVGWPIWMMGTLVFRINKDRISGWGKGFVQVGVMSIRDIGILLRNYVGFQSFVIALCRYLFIVKNSLLLRIGVKRFRYIILSISWVVPIFLLMLAEATVPIGHYYFCFFVPQNSQIHQNNNNGSTFCNQEELTKPFESPFYTFCWENLPLPVNYALLMIRYILLFMFQSTSWRVSCMYIYLHSSQGNNLTILF